MDKLEKGETAESSSSGIGMANVRQRLKLIYGDKSSISFRNRTAGGVKVGEVMPNTMASKLAAGLYFAGEVLDVDAYTGGFNLQIAWATGYLAGLSAAEKEEGEAYE